MSDKKLIIKSFLDDEEFNYWKSRLENSLIINQIRYYNDKEKVKNDRKEESKVYGSLSKKDYLPGEIWKDYTFNKNYQISSLGRVRIGKQIVPQKDELDKTGYLIMDSEEFGEKLIQKKIYELVAETFLDKPATMGYHIHHITNNGYDNSISNLIGRISSF